MRMKPITKTLAKTLAPRTFYSCLEQLPSHLKKQTHPSHFPPSTTYSPQVSTMAKRLIPTLNRVLVEKIIPPSKTTAGILLPESSTKLNSGKVISVGPGLRSNEGKIIPPSVKEGDTVLLPEYGGTQVKLGEKEFYLYRDEDILGTLLHE